MSAHDHTDARAQRRVGWTTGGALGCTIAAVLAPKCPACLWVYLGPLGLGTAGVLAVVLRPTLITLAVLATTVALVGRSRRRAKALPRRC
jgi:hypothetical protein